MAAYPAALEEVAQLPDGTPVWLRPIRPDDWRLLQWGFRRLTPDDRHARFLGGLGSMSEAMARRLATVDYEQQIAFLALGDGFAGREGLGIVRLAGAPAAAEIALVVLPRWKRRGLGRLLAEKALAWARAQGLRRVGAVMLQENTGMRRLAERLGFRLAPLPGDPSLPQAELELDPPRP